MNRIALWILAQFLLLFTAQGVPPALNYAGQVAVNGEAFDGNGLFKFALVNTDGTTTYWSNDGTSVGGSEPQASVAVPVNGGLYAVLLGNTAQQGMGAIDPAVFAQHTDAKLRVWFSDGVNGFQQLSPDRPFASVPYAFTAGTAQTAGSAPIADGAVNLDMLSQDVKTQINATIGLDRLSSEIISKLEQNATITNGSVTGSKMAEGAITTDKLNEQILKYLKPEITSQPQPQAQTVYADTTVSYSVTAEGKYLTYQWKKDGVDLTGETNATINITDANATLHDGNYSVIVSNDFGSAESEVTEVVVSTTWIPLVLPRLELWLDVSDVSSVIKNSNNLVSELRDKSSNKFHAVQSNVSRQPTYTASNSLLNNKPSVLSTSAFGLIGLRTPLITFQEIFVVAYYKGGIDTSFDDYNTLLAGEGHNGAYRIMGQMNSPNWILEGAFNDGGNFKNGTTGSSITILPLPPTILRFVSSSAKSQSAGILYNPLFNDRGWVGGVGEIVALESLSSNSDRQKLEGYLAHKWGLAANLPTDHPYKNEAP
jgi:hypothetical protein